MARADKGSSQEGIPRGGLLDKIRLLLEEEGIVDSMPRLNQYQVGMCISVILMTTERTPRHLISPLGPTGIPPTVRSSDMYISPWL